MPSPHPLGDYLRARRELISPDEAGLPVGAGRRRVAGLRRSEVAALAGISNEYYVKLEQGREVHPTDQVLDALSRALKLDATARSYLHSLVRPLDRRVQPVPLPVLERTRWLIESWPMTAAMILSRHSDIVATNRLMSSLIRGYRPGGNAMVSLLLDPELRELYLDWEGLSSRSIALMRSQVALDPSRVRAQQLIAQLTRDSDRFRELWHRHDIGGMTEGEHPMNHPLVGALTLHYAHFPLAGTDAHTIFLYYAAPGSPSEAALADLAARG
jgi:transcriptional regulator with XRE-family HTH domain